MGIYVSVVNVKADINLSVGDNISLVREFGNVYDENAISCFKEGKFAGHVSASDYTTLDGCLKNIDIVKYFDNESILVGEVVGAEPKEFKNGFKSVVYKVMINEI